LGGGLGTRGKKDQGGKRKTSLIADRWQPEDIKKEKESTKPFSGNHVQQLSESNIEKTAKSENHGGTLTQTPIGLIPGERVRVWGKEMRPSGNYKIDPREREQTEHFARTRRHS